QGRLGHGAPPRQRVAADDDRGNPVADDRDDRLLGLGGQLRHGAGLTPADDPLVGVNAHQDVGRAGTHDAPEPERFLELGLEGDRLDPDDLHVVPLAVALLALALVAGDSWLRPARMRATPSPRVRSSTAQVMRSHPGVPKSVPGMTRTCATSDR